MTGYCQGINQIHNGIRTFAKILIYCISELFY